MELQRAIHALKECEGNLRELLSQAAAAGDYESVIRLTDWARNVAAMHTNSVPSFRQSTPNTTAVGNEPSTPGRAPAARTRRKSRTRRVRDGVRAKYPKFARYKDELVKIGWSKKYRTEYQHKAPRQVVDNLLSQIVHIGASNDLFTTEDIFPLRASDGSLVPSYQAYLVLAWLRSIGLLSQHGRQGYSLTVTTPKPAIDNEWANLPKA